MEPRPLSIEPVSSKGSVTLEPSASSRGSIQLEPSGSLPGKEHNLLSCQCTTFVVKRLVVVWQRWVW